MTASKIEDYDAPAGAFDFIKLGHVIEHLADPRLVIERLAEMMRMGGIILIDTDNARGLSSRLEIFIRRSLGEKVTTGLLRLLRRDGPAGGSQKKRHRYGRLIPRNTFTCFQIKICACFWRRPVLRWSRS